MNKALDKGCAGTIVNQKLIRYLAAPAFTTDINTAPGLSLTINPNVTYTEHLIIRKSLCTVIKNFKYSVFRLSKVISNFLLSFHFV